MIKHGEKLTRENNSRIFNRFIYIISIHRANRGLTWLHPWLYVCLQVKQMNKHVSGATLPVFSYSPCAGNVSCSSMPIARCSFVPRVHLGNYVGRSFILQLKSFRSRIVHWVAQRQLIWTLDLSPSLCTHTYNIFWFWLYSRTI